MSPNKQTIEKYIQGFRTTNHSMILECLTENVIWDIPGAFHVTGKKAFDKEIENENFIGQPDIEILRMIEEDNVVIAEGSVKSQMKNGQLLDALFCDIFEMEEGKIKYLRSYLVNK